MNLPKGADGSLSKHPRKQEQAKNPDKNKKLFPQKLWELIHDPQHQHCLRWSPDGQRVFLNRDLFEEHYLKTPNNQFHTQKAISFVRQMNMYGFRKVDDCYYENDFFKRDCYHLLKNMVRRHTSKSIYGIENHINHTTTTSDNNSLNFNNNNTVNLVNTVTTNNNITSSNDSLNSISIPDLSLFNLLGHRAEHCQFSPEVLCLQQQQQQQYQQLQQQLLLANIEHHKSIQNQVPTEPSMSALSLLNVPPLNDPCIEQQARQQQLLNAAAATVLAAVMFETKKL